MQRKLKVYREVSQGVVLKIHLSVSEAIQVLPQTKQMQNKSVIEN